MSCAEWSGQKNGAGGADTGGREVDSIQMMVSEKQTLEGHIMSGNDKTDNHKRAATQKWQNTQKIKNRENI